jgi:Tfp pilus assembly protein PilW
VAHGHRGGRFDLGSDGDDVIRARRGEETGLSLTELLVTMMITSVVLALIATTLISSLRTSGTVNEKVQQISDARVGMEAMTRRIRVAVPPTTDVSAFESAGPSSMTFFASIAPGGALTPAPTRVSYDIDSTNGCLRETLTPGSGTVPPYTYAAADQRSRCVAFGNIASTSKLFTYFESGSGTTPLGSEAGVVDPADLAKITSVGIDLRIGAGASGHSTTVTSRVTLPNVRRVGGSL